MCLVASGAGCTASRIAPAPSSPGSPQRRSSVSPKFESARADKRERPTSPRTTPRRQMTGFTTPSPERPVPQPWTHPSFLARSSHRDRMLSRSQRDSAPSSRGRDAPRSRKKGSLVCREESGKPGPGAGKVTSAVQGRARPSLFESHPQHFNTPCPGGRDLSWGAGRQGSGRRR